MKKVIYTVLLVLFVAACSKGIVRNGTKPAEGVVETDIVKIIEVHDFSALTNPADACGFYSKGIFYLQNKAEKALIHFTDFEGNKVKTLEFLKGKGPGELMFPTSVRVHDDIIYIYDQGAYRVNIYDIEGEHINEILPKESVGYPHVFEVAPEGFVFNGGMQTRLAVIDRKSGELTVNNKYEKVQMPDNGVPFKGGVLACNSDNGDVYLGYFNAPVTVEVYGIDGEKKKTIMKKSDKKHAEVVWDNSMGMSFPEGDMVIPAMKYFENKLFLSSPTGYEITADGFESRLNPFFIDVYAADTGRYLRKITLKGLEKTFGLGIVGVNEEYLLLLADSDDLKRLNPESTAGAGFLIVKNIK